MRVLPALLLIASASCADSAASLDWPMLGRDDSRNAVSPEKDPPIDFSLEPGKERNVAWSARMGHECYTPPVVSGGLVWVGTDNQSTRDPAQKEDAAVLMCFRELDGAFLWQYVSPRIKEKGRGFDWGPLRGCPLVHGDRLWFVTNRWEVVCLDIRDLKAGGTAPRIVWKRDLVATFGTSPNIPGMAWGSVCSIAAGEGGRIYVPTGHAPPWTGPVKTASDAPALVCLDGATGEVLGREASGIGRRSRDSNWSSPVTGKLRTSEGSSEAVVFFGGADGFLYAFDQAPDPETKSLKQRWRVDCRRDPKDGYGVLATPVVHDGRIFASVGQTDKSEPGRLTCVDASSGRVLWSSLDVSLIQASPVIAEGQLFAPDYMGILRSFDPGSGRLNWKHDPLATVVSTPLVVDGRAYVIDGDQEVLIFDLRSTGHSKRLLVRNSSAPFEFASPVFAHGTLYLCTNGRLHAIRGSASTAGPEAGRAGPGGRAPDAQFVPTPSDVVTKMLEMAQLRADDLLYDLGSGDGRILLAAAKLGSRAVGVEIDLELVERSRRSAEREGQTSRVTVQHQDLLKAEFSSATVVTLYVGARLNVLLVPKLKALRPGSRVISHDFEVPGLSCERVVTLTSTEDSREHRIYLYRIGESK